DVTSLTAGAGWLRPEGTAGPLTGGVSMARRLLTPPRRRPDSPRASRRPRSSFDVDERRSKAAELERDASDPSLWDDPARGQQLTTTLARLRAEIERYAAPARRLEAG